MWLDRGDVLPVQVDRALGLDVLPQALVPGHLGELGFEVGQVGVAGAGAARIAALPEQDRHNAVLDEVLAPELLVPEVELETAVAG